MAGFPKPVDDLITQFSKLPGIGRRTAQRLAFHVISLPTDRAMEFARAIIDAKEQTSWCPVCQNLTDGQVCVYCESSNREQSVICVVAEPRDVAAIERTREFKGVFHVLHGVISPSSNKSPDDIRIHELLARVDKGNISEVILATNPDTEGDTTALYIARLLRPFSVRVTRLAYGIPIGGHVEHADEATLLRALEGRREI